MSLPASHAPIETRPDRLLRLGDIVGLTALSRATVYRQVAAGSFPAPVKIAGASRWLESEVARFIEGLKSGREESPHDSFNPAPLGVWAARGEKRAAKRAEAASLRERTAGKPRGWKGNLEVGGVGGIRS